VVSIIIINYKQKTLLRDCIKSIFDVIKSYPYEIIIINNSPEENLDSLKLEYPSVKLINSENKGFASANNIGAKNSSGEYLFFLNADTIIKTDFLLNFINSFKEIEFGVAGLKLYNTDNTFQLSFWKENTFFDELDNKRDEKDFKKRNINFINEIEYQNSEICEVEWVSGAAMIIQKNVFRNVDGFDERFFLFYEDADLCKRLLSKGLKIYFYPFCKIIHLKGENANKEFANKTYYYSKKSQLIYYRLHNSLFQRLLLRIYLIFRFALLSILTFKKINFDILKLTLGVKND